MHCRLVKTGDKAQLTVCLPRGSGVRTVALSALATAEEATAELASAMHVDQKNWKLYGRPDDSGSPKPLAPRDRLDSLHNASYYFFPLP
jgi:hypothetical protein